MSQAQNRDQPLFRSKIPYSDPVQRDKMKTRVDDCIGDEARRRTQLVMRHLSWHRIEIVDRLAPHYGQIGLTPTTRLHPNAPSRPRAAGEVLAWVHVARG